MTELDQGELEADPSAEGPGRSSSGRGRWGIVALAVVVVAGLGLGLGLGLSGGSTPAAPLGPEGVPVLHVPDLASADSTLSGAPVDGLTCRTSHDQVVKYHIHTHVAIFVDGAERRIPAGAGIAAPRFAEHEITGLFMDNSITGCLYWLHVHADDDVIHVESPHKGVFTLGQFFDVWGQPLGPDQVGPARGTVTAFENGSRFGGNPRDIPLLDHGVVQLDVGTPAVPFRPMTFKVTGSCGAGTLTCAAGG